MSDYKKLVVRNDLTPFEPINPPFNMNAASVTEFAPEVTGGFILHAVLKRLGWSSFADKCVLDFGCGVRLARTINNLGMPFGLYVGIDVNAKAIAWLKENVRDSRFRFEHLDASNALYNPSGKALGADALEQMSLPSFDLATMFSVITHQAPDEARLTFEQLRRAARDDSALYFTAFIDENALDYAEGDPETPGMISTYHPAYLRLIVEAAGWEVRSIHTQRGVMQQPVFICVAR